MTEATPVSIAPSSPADDPIDQDQLNEALEYIRPAIQADGGDIVLLGAEDGKVSLQMVGACGGCPLSMMTLKAGIERILKDRVPGVREVEASAEAPGMDDADDGVGISLPSL
ncbi:MAG: NifU family protein [Actinomycetota bacterium]